MGKTLQRVGLLALILWTLAGFVAFGLASKRVHIVFEEGEVESAQETELALLTDRVGVLSEDLRGLAAAVGENFGALIEELEREKAARLAAVEAAARMAATTARATAAEQVAVPIASVPEPEPVAAEPVRAKSFLSFKLPSDDFSFDDERTFQVLSSLSRVGFDGKSTIHDFTGVADKLEGSFTVNPARPNDGITGELSVRSAGILSGSGGRDEAMFEHLDVENFELITFRFDSFEQGTVDKAGESLTGKVHGRMTIRGIERNMVMSVQAQMDSSHRLVIEGEMPLSQADFKIPVPAKLGMISMEDQVRVWIHILARPMPREAKK